MAVGASSLSSSLPAYGPGQTGASDNQPGVPLGLRGAVSLGSGLRTGLTVVERAIQSSAELSEARERAREALLEQVRQEREASQAETATRRDELLRTESREAATDEDASRQTIEAAVAAGAAGEDAPRGAFVDFTV